MGASNFDACMTADVASLAELISRVVDEDAAAAPIFDTTCLNLLLEEIPALSFRSARAEVRINENAVIRQDFDLCDDIPATSTFWRCTEVLERCPNEALAGMDPCPLVPPLKLNDLIVQRYPPGSLGITLHRDACTIPRPHHSSRFTRARSILRLCRPRRKRRTRNFRATGSYDPYART